jgi:hypothetical protein
MVHVPVQQSPLPAQMSPGWPQNEEGWHVPPAQREEQHCASLAHVFPSVVHPEPREAQVPPSPQVCVQHSPLPEQPWPTLTHAG